MTDEEVVEMMVDQLAGKRISPYLPDSAMSVLPDGLFLKSTEDIEKKSKQRGLHLTLDGTAAL